MIKNYNFKQMFTVLFLILFAIVIDQCTKVCISKVMLENGFNSIPILSFLDFVFVRNTGISFGLFSEGGMLGRYFFSVFSTTAGLFIALLAGRLVRHVEALWAHSPRVKHNLKQCLWSG